MREEILCKRSGSLREDVIQVNGPRSESEKLLVGGRQVGLRPSREIVFLPAPSDGIRLAERADRARVV